MATLRDRAIDVGVTALTGYMGTKVMEPVSMNLYEWESEEARQQEDDVRPGPPYQVAAKKMAGLLGLDLSEKQLKSLGMAFHYGLGVSWAPVYLLLRREGKINSIGAGLLSGALMSLIIDEGMTPALGFSASNRDYPLVTHLRDLPLIWPSVCA